MFWDKKDGANTLPDLPPITPDKDDIQDNEEDEETTERHGLPSFPDSPIQKGFAQAAIKEAISTEEEEVVNLPMNEKKFKTVEIEEWSPQQARPLNITPISPPVMPQQKSVAPERFTPPVSPPQIAPQTSFPRPQRGSEIFVKIDKFYSAKKALDTVGSKLNEIDHVLKKIRETKLREEQELSAWEKEINLIKTRLKDVTENIFEKIE